MSNFFKRIINKIKSSTRDISIGSRRSPLWKKVEKAFKKSHPTCAACNSKKNIQVHHKRPFHLFPTLELDPNNLISLCMDKNECHLLIGHGDNFKAWNPDVEADAGSMLAHPENKDLLVEAAKVKRVFDK